MDINTLWLVILAGLLAAYVVLDGYDLGLGVVHLFTGNRKYRDRFLTLIGPYWDGNEVWLIIAGGVLFAVFPRVYAALLSGFYPHFVLLLAALIFRGLALGLRDTFRAGVWQRLCDICFGGASLLVLGLLGIVGGHLARGVPTDDGGAVRVDLGGSVDVPALLAAGLTAALFTMHGALFALRKSEGEQREYLKKWASGAWGLTLALLVPAVALNVDAAKAACVRSHPAIFGLVVSLLVLFLIYIPWATKRHHYSRAFVSTSLVVFLSVVAFAMLLYPRLIPCTVDDTHSLTIYNAAATRPAMTVMLVILAASLPPAVVYAVFVRLVLRRSGGGQDGYGGE
jgi:cytochrome d ubiquinol oxidase subunit II